MAEENKTNRDDLTFEEAMKGLEQIVSKLEEGDVPLEKAIDYFQEGWLFRKCATKTAKCRKTDGLHFAGKRGISSFQCSGGGKR